MRHLLLRQHQSRQPRRLPCRRRRRPAHLHPITDTDAERYGCDTAATKRTNAAHHAIRSAAAIRRCGRAGHHRQRCDAIDRSCQTPRAHAHKSGVVGRHRQSPRVQLCHATIARHCLVDRVEWMAGFLAILFWVALLALACSIGAIGRKRKPNQHLNSCKLLNWFATIHQPGSCN